ncbi:MAG: hypothetical protein JWQ43_2717, partial [Glaciihabitans sp.]|nr:hypothetical protein [Glaciihabitans sp.]
HTPSVLNSGGKGPLPALCKVWGMSATGPDRLRRRFATAAMTGVVLYVLVDVVLQFLPPHYSPVSAAESNLAVGPFGWVMGLNFLGRALLSGFAIAALARTGSPGLLRNAGLSLFAVAGLCSGALAFFPTDIPLPGSYSVEAATVTGTVHLALATAGFALALVGFLLLTRWIRSHPLLRRGHRAAMVWVVIALVGLTGLGTAILWVPQVTGLVERVCLAGILGWAFTVCNTVRRLR